MINQLNFPNITLKPEILKKIDCYIDLLIEENEQYDLTAQRTREDIITFHIEDTLKITNFIDIEDYYNVLDIGSGAGIPGLLLAIVYPDVDFCLLETMSKRCNFLIRVINELQLKNCFVQQEDFKTFVRKSKIPIDLFITRASLTIPDLLYLFNGSSAYQRSTLVYWASKLFDEYNIIKEKKLHYKEFHYEIGNGERDRKYIMIKKDELDK